MSTSTNTVPDQAPDQQPLTLGVADLEVGKWYVDHPRHAATDPFEVTYLGDLRPTGGRLVVMRIDGAERAVVEDGHLRYREASDDEVDAARDKMHRRAIADALYELARVIVDTAVPVRTPLISFGHGMQKGDVEAAAAALGVEVERYPATSRHRTVTWNDGGAVSATWAGSWDDEPAEAVGAPGQGRPIVHAFKGAGATCSKSVEGVGGFIRCGETRERHAS